jgi:hypothetical protein
MDRHWIIRTSYPAKLPEGGEAFPHPQFFAHVHCPHMQRLIQRGVSPLVVTEHESPQACEKQGPSTDTTARIMCSHFAR